MQQVADSGARAEDTAAHGTVPAAETETLSLTANHEKVHEDVGNSKAEVDELRAIAKSVAEGHQAALSKLREERQRELDLLDMAV